MEAALETGAQESNTEQAFKVMATGSLPAFPLQDTTRGVNMCACLSYILNLPNLCCDIHSKDSKSNGPSARLLTSIVLRVKSAWMFSSLLVENFYCHCHSFSLIWFFPVKGFIESILPVQTPHLSHTLGDWMRVCAREGFFVCISTLYCAFMCKCVWLLSASAPAGASKWIIHARFEYMQMVHSPPLAQIQVTYGNGAFKKHPSTPPPPLLPPPASLRHPPSNHVI